MKVRWEVANLLKKTKQNKTKNTEISLTLIFATFFGSDSKGNGSKKKNEHTNLYQIKMF